MYSLLRFILLLVVVALIAIYKKARKRKFRMNLRVIVPVFCVAFIALLFVTPETNLIGFSSPKAAYDYIRNICSGDYEAIIYGEQSALACKTHDDYTIETTLLLKKKDKWYITAPLLKDLQSVPAHDSIFVYRISDDRVKDVYYYIFKFDYPIEEEGQIIKLNNNTALAEVDNFSKSEQELVKYWFFCLDEEQTTLVLSIDGKNVFSYNFH